MRALSLFFQLEEASCGSSVKLAVAPLSNLTGPHISIQSFPCSLERRDVQLRTAVIASAAGLEACRAQLGEVYLCTHTRNTHTHTHTHTERESLDRILAAGIATKAEAHHSHERSHLPGATAAKLLLPHTLSKSAGGEEATYSIQH
jgi:hypothetical protein